MNRRVQRYDPNATQELIEVSSRSDSHRIEDLQWTAIRNQDAGIQDLWDAHAALSERLVKIETTLRNLQWLLGFAIAALGLLVGLHK